MALRAGSLTERVTLQASSSTTDVYGEEAETWTDVATVHASVRAEKPSERLRAGRLEGQNAYTLAARFPLPGGAMPTTAGRLVWHTAPGGPRTLAVVGVSATRREVQILATDT